MQDNELEMAIQANPVFVPQEEGIKCAPGDTHDWRLLIYDTVTDGSSGIAMAICTKCAEVRGGFARYE